MKLVRFIFFLLFIAGAAGVAWLGGYNFDTRGPHVALFSFFTFLSAIVMACVLGEGVD